MQMIIFHLKSTQWDTAHLCCSAIPSPPLGCESAQDQAHMVSGMSLALRSTTVLLTTAVTWLPSRRGLHEQRNWEAGS